jgi:hypothetical protein
MYQLPGSPPQLLAHVPSPDELKAAGAEQTSAVVERTLALRDQARGASITVQEMQAALREAEAADRREHAGQVAADPGAKLTPKHVQRAQRGLEDAERRHVALIEAVENATNELLEIGSAESEKLIAAARATRERAVEEVAAAVEKIAACVDRLERGVSIARWSTAPDSRRWKVGLRRFPVGRRHGGTPVGQLLEMLSLLPGVLAEVQTPDEQDEEAPTIKFGWPKPGQLGQGVRSS